MPTLTAKQIKALEVLCDMGDACVNLSCASDWRGSVEGRDALATVAALLAAIRKSKS